MVTAWSALALELLPVDPGPVLDSRAAAIVHAAMHDAVNGVARRYEPYTADLHAPGASVHAAVAAAARDALMALSPSQQARVEAAAYAVALAAIADGPAKDSRALTLSLDSRALAGADDREALALGGASEAVVQADEPQSRRAALGGGKARRELQGVGSA